MSDRQVQQLRTLNANVFIADPAENPALPNAQVALVLVALPHWQTPGPVDYLTCFDPSTAIGLGEALAEAGREALATAGPAKPVILTATPAQMRAAAQASEQVDQMRRPGA